MKLNETTDVKLVLNPEKALADLRTEVADHAGKIEGEKIRISNYMEASLTGTSGLKIADASPTKQLIDMNGTTQWVWNVKATEGGKQKLLLTLNVIFESAKEEKRFSVRTFEEEIAVNVSWNDSISEFVSKNWQYLMGTLVIPLVGWFAHRRWKAENGNGVKPPTS
ncbi:MAG: hypothetical protein NVSMB56_11380 [Pyrinomonadaceae bacterium]